jgi:hypothetical protein
VCVCVRASLLTRHQNMWGLLLAKKNRPASYEWSSQKFEANNSGMRVSKNGSLKTKNAHAKNFKFLRIFFANWLDFYSCSKKNKRKKKVLLLLLFVWKKWLVSISKFEILWRTNTFFFLFILEWDSYFSHVFVCVRVCGLGCCLIEKCGFYQNVLTFWSCWEANAFDSGVVKAWARPSPMPEL